MNALIKISLTVVGVLTAIPMTQARDLSLGQVLDPVRQQRNHDFGGHRPQYPSGRPHRPPAPPVAPAPPQFYGGVPNHGGQQYGGRYGNHDYERPSFRQQNDIYRREFSYDKENFRQYGRDNYRYSGERVRENVYRDRSYVEEYESRNNYQGRNFHGLGYDMNGYKNRRFQRDFSGIRGGRNMGHNLYFGIR